MLKYLYTWYKWLCRSNQLFAIFRIWRSRRPMAPYIIAIRFVDILPSVARFKRPLDLLEEIAHWSITCVSLKKLSKLSAETCAEERSAVHNFTMLYLLFWFLLVMTKCLFYDQCKITVLCIFKDRINILDLNNKQDKYSKV